MNCRRVTNPLIGPALLLGGLLGVAAPTTASAGAGSAPEPVAGTEASPAVPEPPASPPAEADVSAPSTDISGSPPDGGDPGATGVQPAVPELPPVAADPSLDLAAPTESGEPEPPAAAIDPGMLAGGEAEPAPTAAPPPRARAVQYDMDDPEQAAAELRDGYAARYRSPTMGARLNVTGRVQFANMGGPRASGVGGRMGGGSIDIGPAWNHFSIAGTLAGWGGRFYLPADTGAEVSAMFGGGPTVGYGRIALLGRGFFDFRVGYHMYYGVVRARRDGATVVASQDADGNGVVLRQTENISPHGPRVRIDLGLLSQANRRRFHAFGLTLGYQGLVHTFRGEMPYTSMLTMGLSYWMG